MAASDPRVYIGPIKMGPLMVIAAFCADSETKTSGEVQCVYNYKSDIGNLDLVLDLSGRGR